MFFLYFKKSKASGFINRAIKENKTAFGYKWKEELI